MLGKQHYKQRLLRLALNDFNLSEEGLNHICTYLKRRAGVLQHLDLASLRLGPSQINKLVHALARTKHLRFINLSHN